MSNWIADHPKRDALMAAWDLHTVQRSDQAADYLRYARDDKQFALWLALVNRQLLRRVGLGLFDLGDFNARDCFDSGASPAQGAQDALEADDTYAEWISLYPKLQDYR